MTRLPHFSASATAGARCHEPPRREYACHLRDARALVCRLGANGIEMKCVCRWRTVVIHDGKLRNARPTGAATLRGLENLRALRRPRRGQGERSQRCGGVAEVFETVDRRAVSSTSNPGTPHRGTVRANSSQEFVEQHGWRFEDFIGLVFIAPNAPR